jgi:hypothetical protein
MVCDCNPCASISLIHRIDEFPTMTKEEAEPFLPELLPLRRDHRYHFEYATFEPFMPPTAVS